MVYASAYAQTLRAVGQALEARHLEDFDLECYEDTFLVRSNERPPVTEVKCPARDLKSAAGAEYPSGDLTQVATPTR